MTKKIVCFINIIVLLLVMTGCKDNKLAEKLRETNPRNDTYYQVFVRSFADSDADGIGDFNGISEKLDYLQDLGVTGLWLMPIHPSPTYHGYDVTDYYGVNEDYGTMDDFKNLVNNAHKRGIKIVLDMVFNHSSDQHEWFQKAISGDAKYRDYYVLLDSSTKTEGFLGSWSQNIWHVQNGVKYCGYFSNTMPDFNFESVAYQEEVLKISKYWIDLGVDGFRLDAALHFFGTNEDLKKKDYNYLTNVNYLYDLREKLHEYDEDFYLMGEVADTFPETIGYFYLGLDSPLDFPISARLKKAMQSAGNSGYVSGLLMTYREYAAKSADFISAPFIANHDEDRIASQVGGKQDYMKLVAELLLALPGSPIMYYGEEVGMFGDKATGPDIWDETRRLPINWGDEYTCHWMDASTDANYLRVKAQNEEVASVSEQLADKDSLLNTYKRMLKVRSENMALKYGNAITAYSNNSTGIQGYIREYTFEKTTQKVLVIHNITLKPTLLPEINGKVLYLSGTDDLTMPTTLNGKSTLIVDITGE